MAKPPYFQNGRLVRKRCGVWLSAINNSARIGPRFRLGIEQSKVTCTPARAVKRESEKPARRVRFLTEEEEKQPRDTIRANPAWSEHEPEMDLAMHTGLRRTNLYKDLVWENVNWKARVATVQITKNGDPVHVPLNDLAMRAMRIFLFRGGFTSEKDATGPVVRNLAGETLNANAHWFVPAVRAAGLKNFHFHDLRHTYASRLRQTGTPLGKIA